VKNMVKWTITAVVLLLINLAAHGGSKSGGETPLILNVGETWQIPTPSSSLCSSFEIKSITQDPGLEVFEFPPIISNDVAECPSTTGPELVLQESHTIILKGYEYQYDYYFLNAGSVVTVEASQQTGASNIYLLKGIEYLKAFETLETDAGVASEYFQGQSILTRISGNGDSTILTYEVQHADAYIFVYDNDPWTWTWQTKIQVDVTVTVATHSLENKKPVCSAADTINGCKWAWDNASDRQRIPSSCIIVKAVSSSMETTTADDGHTVLISDDRAVTVQVESTMDGRIVESTMDGGNVTVIAIPMILVFSLLLYCLVRHGFICDLRDGRSTRHSDATAKPATETAPLNPKVVTNANHYQATTLTSTIPEAEPLSTDQPPEALAVLVDQEEGGGRASDAYTTV
jgi:hypothetical protein